MKRINFIALIVATIIIFGLQQKVSAQYAYGVAAIAYDTTTKETFGYSGTALDYIAGYYYSPYVGGFLYDQYNPNPLDYGYDEGFKYFFPAEVQTYNNLSSPNTEYYQISDHYIVAYYYTSVRICNDFSPGCFVNYWYDPFGYSFLGGGRYGNIFNFFGSGPETYESRRVYYIGSTGVGIRTPPDLPTPTPTPCPSPNPNVPSADSCEDFVIYLDNSYNTNSLNDTVQKGLVGARVRVVASSSPNESGLSFVWKVNGVQQSETSNDIVVALPNVGRYRIDVQARRGEVIRTAKFDIDASLPMLKNTTEVPTGFFADQVIPGIYRATDCIAPYYDKISLGCLNSIEGIKFKALFSAPEAFITEPQDGKIKFVQIGKPDRRKTRMLANNTTVTECNTYLNPSPNGWRLDNEEPYDRRASVAFNNTTDTASLMTSDSPNQELLSDSNIVGYSVADEFEMYAIYFTDWQTQSQDKLRKGIAVLAWNWGGITTRNSTGSWILQAGSAVPSIQRRLTARVLTDSDSGNSDGVRQFSGRLQDDSSFTSCTQPTPTPTPSTTPTPTITPTPTPSRIRPTVWRRGNGTWYIMDENGGIAAESQQFGMEGDIPVPADFDGDGKTDFAVYRPGATNCQNGCSWFIFKSSDNSWVAYNFGADGDKPVPADFDGDGKADYAVYRQSDKTWHILKSGDGQYIGYQFGETDDIPIPKDYDGDGRADVTVWRGATATWCVLRSLDGQITSEVWGTGLTDKPVVGDYDGDGRADLAVWKSDNTWSIKKSSDGSSISIIWGFQTSDVAVQGDYDSDGKTDIAVWRPSEGSWYIIRSNDGSWYSFLWGTYGDIPLPY